MIYAQFSQFHKSPIQMINPQISKSKTWVSIRHIRNQTHHIKNLIQIKHQTFLKTQIKKPKKTQTLMKLPNGYLSFGNSCWGDFMFGWARRRNGLALWRRRWPNLIACGSDLNNTSFGLCSHALFCSAPSAKSCFICSI